MPNGTHPDWPAAAFELLKQLWGRGETATRIAFALHENGFFYKRNAVLGKVHRAGLKRVMAAAPRNDKRLKKGRTMDDTTKGAKINGAIVARPNFFAAEEVAAHAVEYLKLRKWHCRAPLEERGSDGLIMSCGRNKIRFHDGRESAYCAAHHRLFHTTPIGDWEYGEVSQSSGD